ncbi:coproporphyrinogen III oxidase [Helicobacter fennelliae]|uniref:Coproporphyrinogen-III oxidase n=2 Tax=Helicobacter fennelliae TaxID=215 RepID=T1D0A8_9HELI|nr:coproporphyrinogen III oxidase, oxygen-independent [Helicobacter fennelliae MRY12-0050]STP07914.1 coproporphyrinogen III oxidase [Helicobacter fennelliae]
MIDFAKFAKYSKSAPRYTSYPTAVEFHQKFGKQELKESLARNDAFDTQESKLPLSLYVHLPFCRSACYFCGCNVIYTSKEDKKDRYISYLKKELEILKTLMNTHREVVQFHFGGGTPTFFDARQLGEVIALIKDTFQNFAPDAEISCEIDPRYFEESQMKVLKDGGFNRLSFGVQDFDNLVQEAIHRFQDTELVKSAVSLARAYHIDSINFDLIYGLPHQTITSFMETLQKVISLCPDRLAIFNYAHVPWIKKTMRKIDESTLPPPQTKLEILEKTIAFLARNGYEMIGMDHFAKKSDELYIASQKNQLRRNFQGYTTKGFSQTIGIGLTSISEGKDYYAQNYKDMALYESALDRGEMPIERGIRLSDEDMLRKDVIMSLMNTLKLEFKDIEQRYKMDFKQHFYKELQELSHYQEIGILKVDHSGIYTTQTGGLLIRNIAMVFDEYLTKIPQEEHKFSKSV